MYIIKSVYDFFQALIHLIMNDCIDENCLIQAKWNNNSTIVQSFFFKAFYYKNDQKRYSIVKDSSADLGVNFKIVQNRPTFKAVCTKISKNFFLHICQYFLFLRENEEVSFFILWIFKLKQP